MRAGQTLGPFEIEKELGSGAMGTVYRARYVKTGQRVAIKMIMPSLLGNSTAVARFEREIEVLKQLHHPNIVRIYASGRYQGTRFYAMEYIEGESLEQLLQRRGRLTWEEVAEIGKQICAALQHAHEQGIVHRDLKPSNLLLTPDGTLKLADFGIAKDLDVTQLTAANATVGTAAYMSPEQCRGERKLTHRSDLYSLGVVFYELLTGRKPFEAETIMDMFLQHIQGQVERPSRLVLDIPVWLDTLVCQLLEKQPEQRAYDAAAVAQALNRVVEKVSAQHSAGVDVVRARAIDRPLGQRKPDDTDKEIARTLLAAGRKPRRKRRVPFFQRVWFQAAGILTLLAAIGWVFYLAFKPPEPEDLYRQAERLMAREETWDQAREGPITEFLERFPEHPSAERMRRWLDQIEVYQLQRSLKVRYQLARSLRRDLVPEHDAERFAVQALRYEEFKDLALARERWQALALKFAREPERRLYVLLAEKRRDELTAEAPPQTPEREAAQRRDLVESKLTEAVHLLANSQKQEARQLCQEIIDLYSDDPDLAKQVADAKKLRQERPGEQEAEPQAISK